MEPLDAMDMLAGRAAGDLPPSMTLDWSAVIGEAQQRRSRQRTWQVSAITAVTAASVLAATGALFQPRQTAIAQTDPVAGMFTPMNVEMP